MDAQPLTPEPSRELKDLRRRAYGPDADIQRDPEALDRLHELEAQVRLGDLGDRASHLIEPTPEAAGDADTSGARESVAEPETAGSRPGWRRVALWASVAAVGVIGVGMGVALAASMAPHPDATLAPTDHVQIDLEDTWLLSISQWLTTEARPVQHEPFHKLQVLSATSKDGASCLVVTWANHWSDFSCTPQGLTPVVDFVSYLGGPQPLDEQLRVGTVIRFELDGDVVDVTMRVPSPG
ncbi:hypothetical protein [Microbacterium deminutum]|uniref:Uncharacterized protein n=1 Tax=Microbacterium deminutum TaxID=344164 RepID=A0ABP5CAY9_9MICO